jgi:hypothetical protein
MAQQIKRLMHHPYQPDNQLKQKKAHNEEEMWLVVLNAIDPQSVSFDIVRLIVEYTKDHCPWFDMVDGDSMSVKLQKQPYIAVDSPIILACNHYPLHISSFD